MIIKEKVKKMVVSYIFMYSIFVIGRHIWRLQKNSSGADKRR